MPSKPANSPLCSRCGTQSRLVGIEPDKPGHELKTFECPKCQHFDTLVVETK